MDAFILFSKTKKFVFLLASLHHLGREITFDCNIDFMGMFKASLYEDGKESEFNETHNCSEYHEMRAENIAHPEDGNIMQKIDCGGV